MIVKPLYKNGLLFNGGMGKNIDSQKERVAKGKSSMVILDGIPGEGKTTLGIEILEYYQKGPIDYEAQYCMGFGAFVKKLPVCVRKNLHVIFYDEAGDYNKRGWASAVNRHLNRIFEIYRVFEILIIMAGPSFHKYDSDLILTGVPRLLIHCYGRNQNYGCYKGYGLWRMAHIKKKMDNRQVACKHEVYNWVSPNFYGYFKDLPKQRADKLAVITKTGKASIFEEVEISNEGYLDYRAIGVKVNRSTDWVRRLISELKIKPVKIFKRKKYFEKEIVGQLMEHVGGEPDEDILGGK